MPDLPSGTVTFLFTDIEGSTRLWEQHPEAMRGALARHDALLRAAIESCGGHVFKTVGDAFCAAFVTAPEALTAALAAQAALQAEPWEAIGPVRVRVALHAGDAEGRDGDYFGPALNRVARILAAGHGGQVLLSQAVCDLARDALPPEVSLRDLGAHRLKYLQQPERLFQLLHPYLQAEFAPLRSLQAFRHNLPVQLTSFVGREAQMAEVKRLLATTHLLTLTGSGGCGKTRLALQVAAEVLEEYPDGVWLVQLAALADPDLVPQAVAAALGVREEPGRSLTLTLTDYLRPQSLLLVLDNCEHLLAICAQLAESLLRACSKLRILATSREGLNIAGESSYRVPSLSLPDARRLPAAEPLTQFGASRLFLERAVAAAPSFRLTPGNAAAVAQVCRRLDGIPLAIELAAARVKLLSVAQIAGRLDDRFRLLTGGSRTALPRQQTLRAAIDWSYDLLSDVERGLLRRLSVFAGGWTLEAAELVCADPVGSGQLTVDSADGPVPLLSTVNCPLSTDAVLDLLSHLVEKSLVIVEEAARGEARYRLLETVRQYARDRLLESGEAPALRGRHLDFFLHFAEQGEPELHGPEQAAWFERLEAEHDNLRAALEWSLAPEGGGEAGLRLAGALWWFWVIRGHFQEGQSWLERALERSGGVPALRAKALEGAGWIAAHRGDFAATRAFVEQELAIGRELGDKRIIATSYRALGWVASLQGDSASARPFYEQALALEQEVGTGQP